MGHQRLVLSLLVLAALVGACSALPAHEEAFIGWKGETYAAEEAKGVKRSWIQQLSWRPRAYVWHNMLSPEEAKHIRAAAAPQMKRSTVVGTNGTSVEDSYRTSYGTFLRRLSDPVVTRIMGRVSDWTQVPMIHQEDMQVLRYGIGQKYGAHMDSLIDESPRMATVLIYLADTEEGGETAFPDNSEWISDEAKLAQGDMSDCAANHVAYKPKQGDGLLFFSVKTDGTHEPASMHTGCPVVRGLKWTATVWVHSQPFRPRLFVEPKDPPPVDPGLCKDSNPKCETWAASGECEKNSVFMRATCRSSCKVCKECSKGDMDCWRKNREQGGYLVYNSTDFL